MGEMKNAYRILVEKHERKNGHLEKMGINR
jgi:hypothetical protein